MHAVHHPLKGRRREAASVVFKVRPYASVVLLSALATACAAVSGLDGYNQASEDHADAAIDAYVVGPDATGATTPDSALLAAPDSERTEGDSDASSEVTSAVADAAMAMEEATAEATADVVDMDATTAEVHDDGVPSDALEEDGPIESAAPSDAMADATPPKCGPGNCGGCCDANGECVGGESNGTCGMGGASCSDCSSSGKSCNRGVCAAAPPDAGRCSANSCTILTTLCIPVWEQPCCKADGTCGCYITIPRTSCL